MILKIKLDNKDFKVTVIKAGVVDRFPFEKSDGLLRQSYRVIVQRVDTFGKMSFFFYGSHAEYVLRKEINEKDVYYMLYCSIEDALYGLRPFEEFCMDLGYSQDSITAHKIWEACRNAVLKWSKIGGEDTLLRVREEIVKLGGLE